MKQDPLFPDEFPFPRSVRGWTLLVAGNDHVGWLEEDIAVLLMNQTARDDSSVMSTYVSANHFTELYANTISDHSPIRHAVPQRLLRYIARREAKLGNVPPDLYVSHMNFMMQRVQRMFHDGAKGLPEGPLVAGLWYRSPQLNGGQQGLVRRVQQLAEFGRSRAAREQRYGLDVAPSPDSAAAR